MLSVTAEHAVRAVLLLARYKGAKALSADAIAAELGAPRNYLAKTLNALAKDGVRARVVSMPSWDLFAEQDAAYREQVLPAAVTARVACEAACGFGWERWIGGRGRFVGMTGFGASGPAPALYKHFGITADAVVAAARESMAAKP